MRGYARVTGGGAQVPLSTAARGEYGRIMTATSRASPGPISAVMPGLLLARRCSHDLTRARRSRSSRTGNPATAARRALLMAVHPIPGQASGSRRMPDCVAAPSRILADLAGPYVRQSRGPAHTERSCRAARHREYAALIPSPKFGIVCVMITRKR